MKEVDLTLKFITPAFIGAADSQKVSEFRLPSLKGLLRFWWRACQDFPSEAELYKAESQIFGDTTRKAKFSISLGQPLQDLIRSSPRQAFKMPQPGIRYLFYSIYQMGRKSPGRINWLEPGTIVDLQFKFFDEGSMKDVITALWWLENFGGIGARSRRGAGSFRITKITPLEGIEGIPQFMCQGWRPETQNLKEEITNFVKAGIDSSYHLRTSQTPHYTAFRDGISNYKVLTGYGNWEEAADDIGKRLWGFPNPSRAPRSARFQNEARAIHSFASSDNYPLHGPDTLKRPAFGLPIQYRFGDGKVAKASGSMHDRRASPLFIKVGCLPNKDQYYAAVLSFWSKFLPDNEKVTLKVRNAEHNLNQPDKTVIDDFLNSL